MKKRGKEEQGLRRDHQGGEKSPEAIHDLPFDLTIEILSRLPVKILARLRCVSKLWSSSIITESIKTRSLSQPCQLVIFHNSSYISSCTYPVNTTTRFVAADRGSCSLLQRSYYRIYGYVGGLICHSENYKQFAIYNPTTRHNVLLPIVLYHKKNKASDGFSRYDSVKNEYTILRNYLHGFFGYDPVENQYKVLWFVEGATLFDYSCQVITFEGGPNKQKWRKIEIQDDISPPRSNGVCINGIIYYLGGNLTSSSVLVLGRFDVRFERFDHIQMPIDVEMNQLEELNLVNYQGKLGCTFYSKDRAEVWIMKYHHLSENEWSKITIDMSTPYLLKTRIAGVTLKGEIVIMPVTLGPAQTLLYAYFYDPKEKKTRRAEFETNLKGEPGDCILSEPNHMENTISLFGSQFNKKPAKPPSLLKKNPLTTTVFSDKKSFSHKKSFPCPKKLLVVAFSCAVLVLATTFRTWLIPLLDSLHR